MITPKIRRMLERIYGTSTPARRRLVSDRDTLLRQLRAFSRAATSGDWLFTTPIPSCEELWRWGVKERTDFSYIEDAICDALRVGFPGALDYRRAAAKFHAVMWALWEDDRRELQRRENDRRADLAETPAAGSGDRRCVDAERLLIDRAMLTVANIQKEFRIGYVRALEIFDHLLLKGLVHKSGRVIKKT